MLKKNLYSITSEIACLILHLEPTLASRYFPTKHLLKQNVHFNKIPKCFAFILTLTSTDEIARKRSPHKDRKLDIRTLLCIPSEQKGFIPLDYA